MIVYTNPAGVRYYTRPRYIFTEQADIPCPTDAQLIAAGWTIANEQPAQEEVAEPTEEELAAERQREYEHRVQELIAERYDDAAEKAILRQRDTKADEFQVYYDYCEACKVQAREEVFGND